MFVEAPLNTRQGLVKELRKHTDLVIVERPEECDFFLVFAYSMAGEGAAMARDGANEGGNAETVRAEMSLVKFVTDRKGVSGRAY